MKKVLKSSLLPVLAVFMTFTASAADFELVKKEQNIALYERWINHNGNTVRELKVDFIARAVSAENVIALLKDPVKGTQWNKNAKSFKVAYTLNDAAWLTYTRYKIPWPMNDQDCSLKYYFNKSELNRTLCNIYFESVKTEKFPVIDNVTRITGTRGKWVVEKAREGSIKITYQVVTDKSASVPRWISDPVIHENIFKTIAAFKKLLEQA